MKISLIRKSITLGIASVTFLSLSMIENLIAIALPEAEVIEKLNPVPVFTIADEQGAPLVASGEDKAKVAGVFISQDDAKEFVNQLNTENPELAEKVRVVPVSLGEIYKLAGSPEGEENALNFAYVPEEEAVTSAKTIGEENEQPYQGGVPLFVARGGEGKGYLTFERNSKQVIPFFFDKAQLEAMVARFKEQEPEVAASVDIEVHPLEEVIKTLETGSDTILEKIVLVPSAESIEFLENIAVPSARQRKPQPYPNSSTSDIKPSIDMPESVPSRTVPRNSNINLPPAYYFPPPYIPTPAPCC
ncbi:MAG: Tic22 family protein [Cyanobacteria bacterium J06643_13]